MTDRASRWRHPLAPDVSLIQTLAPKAELAVPVANAREGELCLQPAGKAEALCHNGQGVQPEYWNLICSGCAILPCTPAAMYSISHCRTGLLSTSCLHDRRIMLHQEVFNDMQC